jgi:alpha-tubulin suppressor-like RCC1 family protein
MVLGVAPTAVGAASPEAPRTANTVTVAQNSAGPASVANAWGYNGEGQLGIGTTISSTVPVEVTGLSGVTAVVGGANHSLALRNDGTVWAWGSNGSGQLGDGTTANSDVPVEVSGLSGVTAVAAGGYHSIALKNDGTVWTWGYDGYGQLGNGTAVDSNVPVEASGLSGVIAVTGGALHSLAVKSDGTVWSWGYNGFGQLGNGTTIDSNVPVQVSGLSGVTAVAGGAYHSIARANDGTVWTWGYNGYGQLGNGTTIDSNVPVRVGGLSGVTTVAAGAFNGLALLAGTVWTWGRNNDGQLGNGTTTDSAVPVEVSGLTGVAAVAAGALHGLALGTDGTVSSWGYNGYGQLGNGTTTNRDVPVTVTGLSGVTAVGAGTYHSFALKPPPTPVVSGASPSALGQGAQRQTVTITGSGFVGPALVTVSGTGVQAANVVVVSSTEITASVSVMQTASTGPDDITVTNADSGAGSCTACLTIDAAPTVTAVIPNALGQGAKAWSVTISGSGFVSPVTAKIMGAHFLVKHVVVVSSTQITASVTVVSTASPGVYDVKVTNPDHGAGTCTGCFTVDPAPTVVGATPSSLAQGTSDVDVVLSGANFASGATMSFSGAGIRINTLSVDTSGQITVNVTVGGAALTGPRTITVINPDGGKGTCSTCFSVT